MQSKVFISHSSLDHDFVHSLDKKFKNDGIDTFVDDWDIKTGDCIKQKIEEGIEKSDFFMIIFSKNSIQSKWVQEEIDLATLKQLSGKNIKILPVLLDLEIKDIPDRFQGIKAVKFYNNILDETEYSKLVEPIKNSDRAKALNEFQDSLFSDLAYIDAIIKKHKKEITKTEVELILNKIKNEVYARYFFLHADNEIWFNLLKEYCFFVPDIEKLKPVNKGDGFFYLPYWNVLPYLEKLSKNNEFISNDENIKELLKIIKNITEFMEEKIDNPRIWKSFINILINLPNAKIDFEIIKLLEKWIDTKFILSASIVVDELLPKFITDKKEDIEKAKYIFLTCLKYDWEENQVYKKKEPKFSLEKYWLLEGLIDKKHSKKLGERLDSNELIIKLLDMVLNILLEKYVNVLYDYSYIWLPQIPEGGGRELDDVEELLINVLIQLIIGYLESKNDDTKKQTLNILLSEKYKYPIFKRLYLFFIKKYNFFDEFINLINVMGDDLFNDPNYEVENFELLKHFAENLQDENLKKIESIIEKGFKFYTEEDPEQYKLYWKQKWYSALQKNQYFKTKYDEIKKQTGINKEMIGAFRITTGFGYGKSPLKIEDILKMTNEEFAQYTFGFKNKSFDEPTVEALADVLMAAAKEYPDKFISDYQPLLELDYFYTYHIFWGFAEGFKIKKDINFSKVFDFIKKYISKEEFLNGKLKYSNEHFKADYKWALSGIAMFLIEIIKNDEWGIEEKHIDKLKETIMLLTEEKFIMDDKKEEIQDYVSYGLNSFCGRIIEAFINFCLREIRIKEKNNENEKNKKVKWDDDLKQRFEDILKIQNIASINAFTFLGYYLPQFWYMDEKFAKQKIQEISKLDPNQEKWQAFIHGYSYTQVYKIIFNEMKKNYEKIIHFDFKNKNIREQLIRHIGVGYILDWDKELFEKLIKKRDTENICNITKYFWQEIREWQKNNTNDELRKKIFANIFNFWNEQYLYYKQRDLDSNDKKVLSNLCLLTCGFISGDYNLNESPYKNWLLQCAPYAAVNHNESFFLKYLLILSNRNFEDTILEIILNMLDGFIPSWDDDILCKIVEKLDSYNNKETEKIREIMVKNGHYKFKK